MENPNTVFLQKKLKDIIFLFINNTSLFDPFFEMNLLLSKCFIVHPHPFPANHLVVVQVY